MEVQQVWLAGGDALLLLALLCVSLVVPPSAGGSRGVSVLAVLLAFKNLSPEMGVFIHGS